MTMKHETVTEPITEADVMEYAAVSKQYTELGKIRETLNEKIKVALLSGQACPDSTPYILSLQPQHRCVWSAKDIMEAVLKILPARVKHKAIKVIANLSKDTTTIYALKVEVNSAYEMPAKVFGAGGGHRDL